MFPAEIAIPVCGSILFEDSVDFSEYFCIISYIMYYVSYMMYYIWDVTVIKDSYMGYV